MYSEQIESAVSEEYMKTDQRVIHTETAGARLKVIKETPTKTPTGIAGFDEITSGGLPLGRTTLLVGGPGSGKTIFAVQFLMHGAQSCNEPGIFVAFEESPKRLVANFKAFGWKIA